MSCASKASSRAPTFSERLGDMVMRNSINTVLSELGGRLGLGHLALDEDGEAALAFDEVLVQLELDEERRVLKLASYLGKPQGDSARTCRQLLEASFLGEGAAGGMLARSPGSGSIVLHHALPVAGLTLAGLETSLQAFVDTADSWSARLAAEPDEAPPAERGPEPMIQA